MKQSIAEWIKALKVEAATLSLQIEDDEEPDNSDWETDQQCALDGLETLIQLPEPPPEIGCIMVELTQQRWERYVDNAHGIGEDLEALCEAISEAGLGESEYAKALYEPCGYLNNI